MRIVLDYRMRSGGVARYGRDLISGLRQLDDATVVVAGTELGPPFSPPARSRVRRFTQEQKADLLHGTHFELPQLAEAAQVVTIPDLIPLEHPDSMPSAGRRMLFRRLVLTSLRRAQAIIVPSPSTADSLKSMGCDPALVSVIPHGVSSDFKPVSPAKRAMARGRFASGRPYFAAALSSKAHKNQQELLQAAELVTGDAQVVCLGADFPGPKLRGVDRLSDENLRLFYAGAEALVMPSLIEGFGLPALEAMACGTPVVCGEGVGGLASFRPGALVVASPTAANLAAAMNGLAADVELRERLSDQGLAAARELTIDRMARDTYAVYRLALERSTSR